MAFMYKDLHCILNLNELKRKKLRMPKKHFLQKQQLTILMCCNDFDVLKLNINVWNKVLISRFYYKSPPHPTYPGFW